MKIHNKLGLFSFFCVMIMAAFLWLTPSSAWALSPAEETRIDALLTALERQTDMVFIRNGTEYSAVDAVSHLRLKLGKTRNRLSSAEEFIDKVASVSSISGKPYLVQKSGQSPQPANNFLRDLLQQVAPK